MSEGSNWIYMAIIGSNVFAYVMGYIAGMFSERKERNSENG